MKKKDRSIILFSCLFIIMALCTLTFTYAYFTSVGNFDGNTFELNSADAGIAYSMAGSDIELLIGGDIMNQSNVNEDIPVVVGSNSQPVTITLETYNSGGELTCNYDITYEPTMPFYNSSANIANKKELTIAGVSSISSVSIPETDLGNVTNKIVLLEDSEVKLTGVNKKETFTWTFAVSFYNQSFNQDDVSSKIFGGKVYIENLECENTFQTTSVTG